MAVIDFFKARSDRESTARPCADYSADITEPGASFGDSLAAPPDSVAPLADQQPHQDSRSDTDDFIKEKQLGLLFGQALIGIWGSIATAFVVLTFLAPVTPHQLLLRWGMLFLLAVTIRVIIVRRYRPQHLNETSADGWLNRFDGSLLLTGTAWGLAGILLPPDDAPMYNALVGFGIVALVAGSVATYSAHVRSVFAFSIPAILPYAAYLLIVGNMSMVVLGGALLAYLGFVTAVALNVNQDFLRNFAMQRENIRLATELTEQQRATTKLNAELEVRVLQRTAQLEQEATARRETASGLRLYQDIVDTSPDLNSVIDQNYVYLAVNDAYVGAFGASKKSLVGKTVANLAGTDIFENQLKPLIDGALRGETVVDEYWTEYPMLGERYMEARYAPYQRGESIVGVITNVRNITERKQAEDALRESEADYKALFDDAPLGIGMVDLQGHLIRANSAFYRIFGYQWGEDDLKGKTIDEFTHPDDRQLTGDYMSEVRAGQRDVAEVEKRYLRKDGTVMWGQIHVSLVLNARGEPVYSVGQVQDITTRKEAEEALNKSVARYQLAEEVGQLGYWDWDEGLDRLVSCSEQYARIFGMTIEEIYAASACYEDDLKLVHPDDRGRFDWHHRAFLENRSALDIEYRIVTSTGTVRHVHEISAGVFDESGKPIRSFGTLQDITARKHAENELRRSHALYKQAARLGRMGHWEWDEKTDRLIACSQQYADILEMSVAAALEASSSTEQDLKFKHPDDRARYHRADMAATQLKSGFDMQYRIITGSGATRWVHEIAEIELDADGTPSRMFGTLQDITAQKQAEQALAQSSKLAATGQMLARIAHEINNPLAGIKNSFLLLKGGIPHDYEHYEYVGRVDRELDRVSTIVRQMLDQYRPIEQLQQDVEIAQLIDDVILLLEPLCREHEVSIAGHRPDGVMVRIFDSVIRQVLFNVLGNAIKFAPTGDEIQLDAKIASDTLTISVTDHGAGINPDEAEQIFDAFYSGGETNSPGLGLGLSVSRNLLEQVSGSLTFRSTPERETTFVIQSPVSANPKHVS